MTKCFACNQDIDSIGLARCVISGTDFLMFCRNCTSCNASVSDVWYGYGSGEHCEENIAYPKGHKQEGQPIPFWDKRSKLAAMKIAGVVEAGDKIHGMRNDSHLNLGKRTYFI